MLEAGLATPTKLQESQLLHLNPSLCLKSPPCSALTGVYANLLQYNQCCTHNALWKVVYIIIKQYIPSSFIRLVLVFILRRWFSVRKQNFSSSECTKKWVGNRGRECDLSDALGPHKASSLVFRTCSTGSILLAHVHVWSLSKWKTSRMRAPKDGCPTQDEARSLVQNFWFCKAAGTGYDY